MKHATTLQSCSRRRLFRAKTASTTNPHSDPVTPTLLITAIGVIPNIELTVSVDLKAPGNLLYIVGETYPELGGSEYYKLKGYLGTSVPKVHGGKAKHTLTWSPKQSIKAS